MSDIRFYGEGKDANTRQMFLSECGIFHYATRSEIIKCYRSLHPMRHLMVYLYPREEYERNRKLEALRAGNSHTETLGSKYNNLMISAGVIAFDPAEERRKLGFDFEKDNGIER